MVYSDSSWGKKLLVIVTIFLIVSGMAFWYIGINPMSSFKGLNFLGQVTNTTQTTSSTTVNPFLQKIIDEIDVHGNLSESGQAKQRYATTQKLLDALISEF
ncbi:MAG: hypothetical protein P1V18_03010 [Candidatus Gracilibacteria bacterium]|nr:hypothetical protein [Candidatus Gracilibacteria bacterium]